MSQQDSEIVNLRKSIERLTIEIARLTSVLQGNARARDTASQAQFREIMERPEVEPEDRNTPPDFPDDEDDVARV
jgi:hypothetical protein